MKKALYLDDTRIPTVTIPGYHPWNVVRNYDEFVEYISKNGIPDLISFDHDLAQEHMDDYYKQLMVEGFQHPNYGQYKEKTGLDCARWLVEHCQKRLLYTEEVWKDIPGYESIYKVSNFGRIIHKGYNKKNGKTNAFLKPDKSVTGLMVTLYDGNGNKSRKKIHRLVAESFIVNIDNKSQINHIDGNRWNNHWSNLEWCTSKENNEHAINNNIRPKKRSRVSENTSISIPIAQYDINNNLIDVYGSSEEAARQLGFSASSIRACARNLYKTSKGFIWKNANDLPITKPSILQPNIDYKFRHPFFIPDISILENEYKTLLSWKACCHSHNPVGSTNIQSYINGFKKHTDQPQDCFIMKHPFEIKN
jgi:predicted 3-demethylubiquinone-9 3-methyltransferase (glyoxalase superfamily)